LYSYFGPCGLVSAQSVSSQDKRGGCGGCGESCTKTSDLYGNEI
jgi:hypothetical protein